jgi:hypothetical protein
VKKTGTAAGKELLAADEESLVMKIKKPPLDRAAVIAVRSARRVGFWIGNGGKWLRLEMECGVTRWVRFALFLWMARFGTVWNTPAFCGGGGGIFGFQRTWESRMRGLSL